MTAVTAVPIRPIARGSVLRLWIGIVLLALVAAGIAWLGTRGLQRTTTASGLQYQVLKAGEGAQITQDDMLRIHLIGRRENGEIFANTLGGQPMETPTDTFIPGFSEGLKMMRPGARYRFWIPPGLGYQGNVPPNAPFAADETLVFDIQVVDVAPGMAAIQRMQQLEQLQRQLRQGGPGAAPGAMPPSPEGAAPPPPDGGTAPPAGPAPPPAGR